MGADGGTIPTRDELVRTRKKPEQVTYFYYFTIFSLDLFSVFYFQILISEPNSI